MYRTLFQLNMLNIYSLKFEKLKEEEEDKNFEELNWTLMDDGYCGRAIIESFYRRVRQSRERNDDASCGGFMDDVDDDGC